MKEILEKIKAIAKDGSNVAEIEEALSKYAIPTDEKAAIRFILDNKALNSVYQAELSRKNEDYRKRYSDETRPTLEKEIREAVMKELNPEETPEMKRIRAAEERAAAVEKRLADKEAEAALIMRREALRKLATEKSFDPELAAELAVYGDEAEAKLDFFAERFKGQVDAKYEETARQKLGDGKPPAGGGDTFDMAKAMPGFLG